jgi:hypothetical protein
MVIGDSFLSTINGLSNSAFNPVNFRDFSDGEIGAGLSWWQAVLDLEETLRFFRPAATWTAPRTVAKLGFEGIDPAATGRPSYHPERGEWIRRYQSWACGYQIRSQTDEVDAGSCCRRCSFTGDESIHLNTD